MTTIITDGRYLIADRVSSYYGARNIKIEETKKIEIIPPSLKNKGEPLRAIAFSGSGNMSRAVTAIFGLCGYNVSIAAKVLGEMPLQGDASALFLAYDGKTKKMEFEGFATSVLRPAGVNVRSKDIEFTSGKPYYAIGSGSSFWEMMAPLMKTRSTLLEVFLTCAHFDEHSGYEYSIFDRKTGALLPSVKPKADFVKKAVDRVIKSIDPHRRSKQFAKYHVT